MKKGLCIILLLTTILLLTGCFDKTYVNDTIVCTKKSSSTYSVTNQYFEIVVEDGNLKSASNIMNIEYYDEYSDQFNAKVLRDELNDRLKKYGDIKISVNEKGARIVITFTNENLEKYFGYTIEERGSLSKFINKVKSLLEDDGFKC